jgi:hypothetical protein
VNDNAGHRRSTAGSPVPVGDIRFLWVPSGAENGLLFECFGEMRDMEVFGGGVKERKRATVGEESRDSLLWEV